MYLKNELYKLIQSDESIFDFIQNSLFDGFWYWDLENPDNQWINDRFWTMLGYNPDEMPHHPAAWQSIINQDDLKLATYNFTRHCEDPNHPYDQVVRFTHKNGSTVWLRCRGMAIRDANGKPVRMLGANQVVTELKRREEELFTAKQKAEESEENLKSILENLQDTFFQADLAGNFTFANSRASGMYGYSVKEIIGTPAANLYADANERKTLIENLKKEGKLFDWTCRGLKKDGTSFWVSMNVQFTKDYQGNIIGTEGIVRDITEKKKAEQELKEAKEQAEESEEKFRLLHENAGLGIGYYSPDGIVISYNQTASKHMNGKPEDFIGKSIFELFPKESADFYFNRLQNAINSSQPMVYEDFVQLPTEDKWFISTFTKIENAHQKVLGIQIISQDVTKIKTTEIELQKAKEKAEESEANLIAALENSQAGIAIAEYPSGKLKYVNKAALLIRDKEYDEIVKDIDLNNYVASWQILHFDGTPYQADQVPLARAILYGETSSREFIVRRDNNEDRYVWANAAPIYNAKGIQTSAIVVFLDITLRKQAEQALLAKIDELERFHKLTVSRETTMVELKKEVNRLLNKLGEDNKYRIVE